MTSTQYIDIYTYRPTGWVAESSVGTEYQSEPIEKRAVLPGTKPTSARRISSLVVIRERYGPSGRKVSVPARRFTKRGAHQSVTWRLKQKSTIVSGSMLAQQGNTGHGLWLWYRRDLEEATSLCRDRRQRQWNPSLLTNQGSEADQRQATLHGQRKSPEEEPRWQNGSASTSACSMMPGRQRYVLVNHYSIKNYALDRLDSNPPSDATF
nr:hypothetical protein CFP56_09478 [Quercus suber]